MQLNRPTVAALAEILGNVTKVLDHGFVRLVDYMGNDESIVQAARVSYGEGTKTLNTDVGLINYLMRHRHTTPFEMCEIKFHLKMPIFVARQWLRHRTASINEISARYSIIKEEFFVPQQEDICRQSTNNKQGRGDGLSADLAQEVRSMIEDQCKDCFSIYDDLLGRYGVARELSRVILPQGTYTEFYWKVNLHNLLHFLSLRCDSKAQKEIRAFAEVILDIVKRWVPIACHAFHNYRINSVSLSSYDLKKLAAVLNMTALEDLIATKQATKGEEREFIDKLSRIVVIIRQS